MEKQSSTYVTRQLQIVFAVSVLILLVSSYASFYTNRKLIESSQLVNHTNEVIIQAETLISIAKDAETGQRGFVITNDPAFLQPYNGAYDRVMAIYGKLKQLTSDNPIQQQNLIRAKAILAQRFAQMAKVLELSMSHTEERTTLFLTSKQEMLKGKILMDDLRAVVEQIKGEEKRLLIIRQEEQQDFIKYTPVFVVAAAVISILISLLAYARIKKDLDGRIEKQKEDEAKYLETAERINRMEAVTRQIADGNYKVRSIDAKKDELGKISTALNAMTQSLEQSFDQLNKNNWLQTGAINIADAMRGARNLKIISSNIITEVAKYTTAHVGTLYVTDIGDGLRLAGAYAANNPPQWIPLGAGLTGQAVTDKAVKVINELPPHYLTISSSIGNIHPAYVVIVPLVYNSETIGVLELGFLRKPDEFIIHFLEQNAEPVAIGLNAAVSYEKMQELLEETQSQAEELQAQHNELENLNTELEAQTQKLQASEEELKVQQEELLQSNQELEERSRLLEERNQLIAERNHEIQRKAEELELSTRYKSEFLANMSHELRTPLNSILLLSRLLSENHDKNLSEDQVEYAQVIQNSGTGLLSLIDEILDLSKIEAGKMELEFDRVVVDDIANEMRSLFTPIASEKAISFEVNIADGAPSSLDTDKLRLEQIIRNLLSNAIKFTSQGRVVLFIRAGTNGMVEFSVKDTGIGIPKEKQQLIFEAFQQADGSTRRKYGGTGLGLSISRQLAKLLGGNIRLVSEPGHGSEFILTIPEGRNIVTEERPDNEVREVESPRRIDDTKLQEEHGVYIASSIPESIPDDRNEVRNNDKVLLIVEDDTAFAKALLDFTRSKGYKGIVSVRGDEAIQLAKQYLPVGVLLDVQLPVMSGWEVMEALKQDINTRHIPVHIMSSHTVKKESLMKGAIDFVNKPVSPERLQSVFNKIEYVLSKENKKVLIIEENRKHAKALSYFLDSYNVNTQISETITDGVSALQSDSVDCVILDMGIPDASSYQALEQIKDNPGLENLPIIVFTGKSLSKTEEERLRQYADTIVVKTAHSYKRILDEVSLFLHLVEEHKQEKLTKGRGGLGTMGEVLRNKTILVTDDDVRNIFSLTKALEAQQMNVLSATDGKDALRVLREHPATDIVLMDIMMPEMDGYETMKRIRTQAQYRNLPIIAVTAKAMVGDREKCIRAGASDYISKPVDVDQLLSLLRVWLYDKS